MNHNQQPKGLVYIRYAFLFCAAIAVVVGVKGYNESQRLGQFNHSSLRMDSMSDMQFGAPDGSGLNLGTVTQIFSVLTQAQNQAQPADGRESASYSAQSVDAATAVNPSTGQTSIPGMGNDGQPTISPELVAYAIRTFPQNMQMIQSLGRAERDLTEGDSEDNTDVDKVLAHPLAQTSDPSQSGQIPPELVAAAQQTASQYGSQDQTGNTPTAQVPSFNPAAAVGQLVPPQVAQALQSVQSAAMGIGVPNNPFVVGIICFAFGLAARRMFKREDPSVIYRPTVNVRPPSVYTPAFAVQNPRVQHFATHAQYKPYFVGQELEMGFQTPSSQYGNHTFGKLRQSSQMFMTKSRKAVRRFLEL